MKINDRIIGSLAILGGIGIIAGTLGFREIPGQQFGSAFFPRILGGAFIALGAVLVANSAKGRLVEIGDMLKGRAGVQVLLVLLGVVIWTYVSPFVGFITATALLIALLALLAGGRPIVSIATGVGMAIVLFLIFGRLLRVPLPISAIERILS